MAKSLLSLMVVVPWARLRRVVIAHENVLGVDCMYVMYIQVLYIHT